MPIISYAKIWNSLTLTALDYDSIKTDEQVIKNIIVYKKNIMN